MKLHLVSLLVFILILVGCGNKHSVPGPEGKLIFSDTGIGLNFVYPDTWQVDELDNENLILVNSEAENEVINIKKATTSDAQEDTIKWFYAEELYDVEPESLFLTNIGGREAVGLVNPPLVIFRNRELNAYYQIQNGTEDSPGTVPSNVFIDVVDSMALVR